MFLSLFRSPTRRSYSSSFKFHLFKLLLKYSGSIHACVIPVGLGITVFFFFFHKTFASINSFGSIYAKFWGYLDTTRNGVFRMVMRSSRFTDRWVSHRLRLVATSSLKFELGFIPSRHLQSHMYADVAVLQQRWISLSRPDPGNWDDCAPRWRIGRVKSEKPTYSERFIPSFHYGPANERRVHRQWNNWLYVGVHEEMVRDELFL